MTTQVFVGSVEEYYGKYTSKFKRDIVAQYVERIPAAERDVILMLLIEGISDQYRSIPDVAAIAKVRQENEQEIAKKSGGVWKDALTGNCYIRDTFLGYYDGHTFIPNTMMQDRGKLGYICNPLNEYAYVEWLREQKLLPEATKALEIEARA
jgi:hypothetical protein